jgi:hypothetical protein
VFRYDVSKYRFGPDLTGGEARALATQIAHEKYMPADWDWQHSREQAIQEISDSLYDMILDCLAAMKSNVGE